MLTIILLILYFSGCLDLAIRDNKEITPFTTKEILLFALGIFVIEFFITIVNLSIINLIF